MTSNELIIAAFTELENLGWDIAADLPEYVYLNPKNQTKPHMNLYLSEPTHQGVLIGWLRDEIEARKYRIVETPLSTGYHVRLRKQIEDGGYMDSPICQRRRATYLEALVYSAASLAKYTK